MDGNHCHLLPNQMIQWNWFLAYISDIFNKLSKLSATVDSMCWWALNVSKLQYLIDISHIRIVCMCMCRYHTIVTVCSKLFQIFWMDRHESEPNIRKKEFIYCMTEWDADKKPRKFVDIIKTKRIQCQTVAGSNVQQHTLSSLRWPEKSWQLKVGLFVKTEFGVGMRMRKIRKLNVAPTIYVWVYGIWDPLVPVIWERKWTGQKMNEKKTYRQLNKSRHYCRQIVIVVNIAGKKIRVRWSIRKNIFF